VQDLVGAPVNQATLLQEHVIHQLAELAECLLVDLVLEVLNSREVSMLHVQQDVQLQAVVMSMLAFLNDALQLEAYC
jgi:hypothetical protein